MRKLNIAVIGATGLVGSTFVHILEEKDINIDNLYLYASKRSKGKKINYRNKEYTVIELNDENIRNKQIDYALFSAGGSISREFAKTFVEIGAIVIDNSSEYRMNNDVPLVVPEVNMDDAYTHSGIISNPNCSTIQSVIPLSVISRLEKIKSVSYTTYQAVSGSGLKGIEDLKKTSKNNPPKNYQYPIYNNVLPQIDAFLDNGYTFEEIKMILETKKILGDDNISVTATCVRVPVFNSHSVEISVELENEINIEEFKKELSLKEGVVLLDDINKNVYPIPTIATGTDNVYVGRVRKHISNNRIIHMFCVADNIRKGAALNAIQILEKLERGRDLNV